MRKTYDSFEEVDKDLKILDLRRQIAQEQVKGNVSNIKEGLQPPEILSILGSGMLKKLIISSLLGYVLRRFRK
ncbi:DUF6327 family protein [Robiginitalea sp.]|jgi:hypothetical protein|uniref:DUF6327 family protein n=1 Tax=Robiginitalea sp. TaxID=1902411 RepID=UPI003C769991